MIKLLAVAVGGGIGSIARYLVSQWAAERWGVEFPYGTLIVNVVGCFIIGAFMTLFTERLVISPYWRLLIAVGFLGGLTTFSSFGYETLSLMEDAEYLRAFYNVGLNVTCGFLATWVGVCVARLV